MNKEFLSKSNTTMLYKKILEKNNLQALPRHSKQIIVDNLVGNMKEIFKSINLSKVNKGNLNLVLEQFNNMCIDETAKKLSNSDIFNGEDTQVSRVKFTRDFNSMPEKQVKFLERNTSNKPRQNLDTYKLKNQVQKSTSSLDSMFQPLSNDMNNSNIGYLNTDFDSKDANVNNKMENISKMREVEENRRNGRPPTPDFLKSQKTQPDKVDYEQKNTPSQDVNLNNFNSEIEAINFSQETTNDLASYSGGDNYFSFDDMTKTVVSNDDIQEDNSTFEERLKRIQSEREGNIEPISSNQENNKQIQNDQDQQRRLQMQNEQDQQRRLQMQNEQDQQRRLQMQNEQDSSDTNSQLNLLLNRLNSLDNSKEINNLKEENTKLKEELKKIESIRERISSEFIELTKKNELIEANMIILNQRELELNSKESEINNIIENYRQLLESRFLQMNISSDDNSSKYTYYLDQLDNIISIKLLSYSIPQARYNIDSNSDFIEFSIEKENKKIVLDRGKYNIELIIEKLNKNPDLNFKLNLDQTITITSDKEFELKEGKLINSVLGILSEDKIEKEDDNYIVNGTKTWDLRLPDKLFLYITNINTDPISILFFNGKSESQIQFEEPTNLNRLDIELRDEYDNLYDFNNLRHSLNLQLELINQFNYSSIKNQNLSILE